MYHFNRSNAERKTYIVPIFGDGNCLFRSISYCLHGDCLQDPKYSLAWDIKNWNRKHNFSDRSQKTDRNLNYRFLHGEMDQLNIKRDLDAERVIPKVIIYADKLKIFN